jgi:hypothetical protein
MLVHPACLSPEALLQECSERFVRRSGPGGQHRNKVETGVVLTHTPTGFVAEASERRTQSENRRVALRRLRRTLAVELRAPISGQQPSPLWTSRIRHGRLVLNDEHEDYPSMLAEALDRLAAMGWETAAAAEQLGISPSQLVKLLKSEPRAIARLNSERAARGLSRLK